MVSVPMFSKHVSLNIIHSPRVMENHYFVVEKLWIVVVSQRAGSQIITACSEYAISS